MKLNNKHVIVTGGSGIVGSSIVEAFVEEGYIVTSISRSGKKRKHHFDDHNNLFYEKLDLTNEEEFKKLLEKIISERGNIYTLVNCCSHRPMTKGIEDEITKWEESIISNAMTLFIPSRLCIKHMIEKKIEGSIITISSIYGIVAPQFKIYEGFEFVSEPDYSYNKYASIGFTKYLASLYAKKNITANVIAPGGFLNNQPQQFLEKYNAIVPQGNMANKNDIKGLVLFLASEKARYINGAVIPLDGGWTAI